MSVDKGTFLSSAKEYFIMKNIKLLSSHAFAPVQKKKKDF